MALFMDVHEGVADLTQEAVAGAHSRDLEVQGEHGVNYLRYWFNAEQGTVFCLVDAPDAEAATQVHRTAHGLLADRIVPVQEGS